MPKIELGDILRTWLCCDNLESFEKGLESFTGYIAMSKIVCRVNIDEMISTLLSLLLDIDNPRQTAYKQELMERTENLKELWNNRFPPAPSLTPIEKKKKKKGQKCLAQKRHQLLHSRRHCYRRAYSHGGD